MQLRDPENEAVVTGLVLGALAVLSWQRWSRRPHAETLPDFLASLALRALGSPVF